MKKAVCFILLLSLFPLSLFSCSEKAEDSGRIKVLGTVFPHFDFAREVGGEFCDVEMLISPGSDSHSYSGDDPADILKIAECDLFIYTGGESDEKWVTDVLRRTQSAGTAPKTVSLTDACETLEESDAGITGGGESGDGKESEADEHVWTSPKNAERCVMAIRDALCEIDPEHSDAYTQNADKYIEKLSALDEKFRALSEEASCHTLVFADRFPFLYFTEEYGFEWYAAFNGCSSQSEPSPSVIVKLCEIIDEQGLTSVFYTESSESSVPRAISKATGAVPTLLHSCHTVTQKQLDEGVTYLELMESNYESLKEALSDE